MSWGRLRCRRLRAWLLLAIAALTLPALFVHCRKLPRSTATTSGTSGATSEQSRHELLERSRRLQGLFASEQRRRKLQQVAAGVGAASGSAADSSSVVAPHSDSALASGLLNTATDVQAAAQNAAAAQEFFRLFAEAIGAPGFFFDHFFFAKWQVRRVHNRMMNHRGLNLNILLFSRLAHLK